MSTLHALNGAFKEDTCQVIESVYVCPDNGQHSLLVLLCCIGVELARDINSWATCELDHLIHIYTYIYVYIYICMYVCKSSEICIYVGVGLMSSSNAGQRVTHSSPP